MALPETTRRSVEKTLAAFCDRRVPARLRDQVRLGFRFRGDSATLFEQRPAFQKPSLWVDIVVAQFRYDPRAQTWTLYCADRNSRWHEYEDADATRHFATLLQEVDQDPTGIFWG